MSLLRNLKEWFLRLFKLQRIPTINIPSVWIPSEETTWTTTTASTTEYNGPDLRFYTENYNLSVEDKKKLVTLSQRGEFRALEKYLDWRINASAHRMKALLVVRKDDEAANEAAAIDSLVKITQDMQNFWTEVKLLDAENEILINTKNKKKPKVFGEDSISLGDNNETVGL